MKSPWNRNESSWMPANPAPINDMAAIVIDACVARAAGGEGATHPVSIHCRDFLVEMQKLTHNLVRTDDIWVEWKNHKSKFAMVWLSSMTAKRRIHKITVAPDVDLRAHASGLEESAAAAMLKDCHLVEAAKAADQVVVSQEKVARHLFANAAHSVGWLKMVAWVDPTEEAEKPIDWLKKGATAEKPRCFS